MAHPSGRAQKGRPAARLTSLWAHGAGKAHSGRPDRPPLKYASQHSPRPDFLRPHTATLGSQVPSVLARDLKVGTYLLAPEKRQMMTQPFLHRPHFRPQASLPDVPLFADRSSFYTHPAPRQAPLERAPLTAASHARACGSGGPASGSWLDGPLALTGCSASVRPAPSAPLTTALCRKPSPGEAWHGCWKMLPPPRAAGSSS